MVVLGEPITKSNAGKMFRGKFTYDSKFKNYETMVKTACLHFLTTTGKKIIDKGPVICNITYYLSSHRVKDLPNLPKTTCDALNGAFYKDDSQIVEMNLKKKYDKLSPRVEIEVIPLAYDESVSLPTTLREPKPKTPRRVSAPKEIKPRRKSRSKLA